MREREVFKGKGDGKWNNGPALSAFLSRCAGKKTAVIGKGIYATGPVSIPSGTHLVLEEGAVLSFIPDFSLYPPVSTWWEGVPSYAMHPCLFIHDAHGVTLEGPGVLRGNGGPWWDRVRRWKEGGRKEGPSLGIEKKLASLNPGYASSPSGGGGRELQFLRPPLMQIFNSDDVLIRGIRLEESPFWTLHALLSENITIDNVSIHNPPSSPNTDGIDIEMCRGVIVKDCAVDVGDDGIAIKSGSGEEARRRGREARNISIRGCTVRHGHGGVVIGSETASGVSSVKVENCLFDGTDRGIRIKTRRGRGGVIRDISVENVMVRDSICPISINMFYRCGDPDMSAFSLSPLPVGELTPEIRDIRIKGLVAQGIRRSAAFVAGLPERPVSSLLIDSCSFSFAEEMDLEAEAEMCRGIPYSPFPGLRMINADATICDITIPLVVAVEYV